VSRPALAGSPTAPVAVPAVIAALAGDDTVVPVWQNVLGGLTFRLDGGDGRVRYAKWVAAGTPEIDLAGEAERLMWAQGRVPVPHVLDQGDDSDGTWLVTEGVAGRSAVDPRWIAEPAVAAAAIGRGLRLLHDALPVDECPFDWSVERRLARTEHRRVDLAEPPPIDSLVVCHGDACAPNTLLHDDGTFAAHVDMGSLGVADRWADLAVAAWSTEWNYGPGYEGHVYKGYGIAPDPRRIDYYRLLWDMS
jgi:kanamycin kinase